MIDYFFTSINMKLYYLQQQLSLLISLRLSNFTPFTFLVLWVSGILTSLNPCLLSVLPLSISYLYGNRSSIKLKNKIMFLVGVISSLICLILTTSLVSQQYYSLISKLPLLSSIFIVILGLNLLQIIHFYDFFPNFNNSYYPSSIQLLQNYFIGLVLGLSSIPCSTPIILVILTWLLNAKQLFLGSIYLCIYCIGYLSPLVLFVNWIINWNFIPNIIRSWNYIIPISGSCILGFGIFSFLNKVFI
uniref:thiol:disulfide interchange protein n=1 Tax=Polyopes affinis TaxID=194519 RepID=UPI002A7F2404|nr:thiol:disulfide interchange protein [Polyopes affinis]WOL36978.1 thiol:disulfide interchange protein [Polyopes affinis]